MLAFLRRLPVRSWKTNRRRWTEKTKGMLRISAYSSACCIPSPMVWLLSFASINGSGMFGL